MDHTDIIVSLTVDETAIESAERLTERVRETLESINGTSYDRIDPGVPYDEERLVRVRMSYDAERIGRGTIPLQLTECEGVESAVVEER